ncbi:ABC transporter permease subunit [Raoultibacter phocaeensis]|uniref:ABC transporter permease subunit n=1 Tax=Raoultibacter phocaeensis TaxID=2479841 RepID=UPI001117D99B|nr:ABC transporter permease subunit [Raoultibacter phocaeensis]
MTVFAHEMRQNAKMLAIWSVVLGGLIAVCLAMFPEMEAQSADISELFASMGVLTEAFGMDRLSMADPMGYFGIQAGSVLGIGGAFFAAYLGIRMLSKEETEHTAEFLLTHPVSRVSVALQKLAAVVACIAVLNLVCAACSTATYAAIGVDLEWDGFWAFTAAQLVLQLEIAFVCFAASAFLGRGSVGAGLGLAALLYFLNIVGNLSDKVEWVRYITPFAYADASNIIPGASLDTGLVGLGALYGIVALAIACAAYARKDIAV